MKGYVTAGLTVLAGLAIVEAALIPAAVIGGAAVLAPKYLPGLRRSLRPAGERLRRTSPRRPAASAAGAAARQTESQAATVTVAGLGIKQAVAKTITFRVIVTALDFTTNYVVIGELTTAAGLSTFNLIVGPLFYLTHEAAWNYFGPPEDSAVEVRVPHTLRRGSNGPAEDRPAIKISRALAKTVTFRTIATIMDFTTNYVVVGDVATAVGLSAFAFVVGPFVYLGHEKLWDYYGSPQEPGASPPPAPVKLLPAPA